MRGHIRKRGGSWCVVIYLGRNPETGKELRKWYSFKTKREAELRLAGLVAQAQGGGVAPPSRIRLSDFLNQWLRDYASARVAATTLAIYELTVRKHIIPELGHIYISRLSPEAVQAYVSRKLRSGLSPATVHQSFRVLKEALGHAVRWGLLTKNPVEYADPPRIPRKQMQVWDEEQVRMFLAEAKRSSNFYPLYLTAVLTRMRRGELLGLRWQDVDLSLGRASIHQIFYRLGRQPIFKEPKSATSRRTIALSSILVDGLLVLKQTQHANRAFFGPNYEDHDLVFCQPSGKPLHGHNVVTRDFLKVIKRAKLPRIRFHDLRHGHATQLLKQGTNVKVVSERLGHSAPAFTLQVYSHVLPGMQEEAAKELEARLLGHPTAEGSPAGEDPRMGPPAQSDLERSTRGVVGDIDDEQDHGVDKGSLGTLRTLRS